MKPRGFRLHQRLSVALFLLLFLIVAIVSTTLYFLASRLTAKTDSLAALPIIDSLAENISAHSDHISSMEILLLARKAVDMLPGAQIYIVDAAGYIVADLSMNADSPKATTVDPTPIAAFADHPFDRKMPVYHDDPGAVGHRNLFIAAPVIIEKKKHYLYAILEQIIPRETTDSTLDRFLPHYAAATIGVLLCIGIVSVTTVFSLLTRRMSVLVSVVDRYRNGDFAARTQIKGNDEVSELADSVNLMAQTIEQQITELKTRDELRRELIASVSHDLRGPVGVLKLCTQKFATSELVQEDAELSERCRVLDRSTESLSTLLSQLFELAKLETREQAPECITLPCAELLGELVDRYKEYAETKGIQLLFVPGDDTLTAYCDPVLIERAIANLLENAITYTLDGGSVRVFAEKRDGGVWIAVQDTGVGIAAEDLQHVFDRTFRVRKWASRSDSSGGLGLAIVKKIIEVHGSTIEVESKENEGSCFSFVLPLHA